MGDRAGAGPVRAAGRPRGGPAHADGLHPGPGRSRPVRGLRRARRVRGDACPSLPFRSLATVAEQGRGGIGMPRSSIVHGTRPRRRELLALAGLGAAAILAGRPGRLSAAGHDHPKTDLTPDQALERLRAGNARFVADPEACTTDLAGRRSAAAPSQAPWATVIACADSRVPPGLLFGGLGLGLGELFVPRNAGNLADQAPLGTVEYGAAVLGSPLIVVLGHTRCGAVEAACEVVTEHATFPGAIG